MKILIACEFSGVVREAFKKKGHDVWSCDILPSDIYGKHYQGDVFDIIGNGWDMMIAHPPCTHLATSGARWFAEKRKDGRQQNGIDFFIKLANVSIDKIAIENPVGIMSAHYKNPDQYIQPYEYGHPYTKKTCLWLKNLPLLRQTNIVEPVYKKNDDGSDYKTGQGWRMSNEHFNTYRNGNLRSITLQGWADAMADQWG